MKKRTFRSFLAMHTGKEASFPIEHRLFNRVSFFGGIVGIGTLIINYIISADTLVTIGSGIVTAICFFLFYLSRFKGKFEFSRWIITFMLFGLFSLLFYINNGSFGPMLYLYMVFFFLILFIWSGRVRWVFITLFIVNIAAFFLLEMKRPDLIQAYPENRDRLLDVYLSYFMYVALAGLMLNFAKVSYINERKKAQQADRLKSAFLANMSHEIRTPMNAILGFTQLLRKDMPEEQHDSYLSVIRNNSESLLRLIEDIIDISKIEAGELSYHEEACELSQVLKEVTQISKQSLESYPEKNIEIIEDFPGERWIINADRTRLKQVLTNLISNALKFTEKGHIRIGYEKYGEWIRFFVQDTGCGIPEENHDEIFERFRKLEHGNDGKILSGTGIGLSISKNLVQMMGGTIGLDSSIGEGSEFYFTVPAKGAKILEADILNEEKNQDQARSDISDSLILVAEDDYTNFLFLKKVLEGEGVKVIRASDCQEACEIFRENSNIDMVLMDIKMPRKNGVDATREMKEVRPSVPIIVQTGQAMQGDAQEFLNAGCDDYISKPIRMTELLQKISKHLKEST